MAMAKYQRMRYTSSMKKSLLETNPYLKDSAEREKALTRNVVSSSAIESIWVIRDATTGRFVSTNIDRSSFKSSKTSQ